MVLAIIFGGYSHVQSLAKDDAKSVPADLVQLAQDYADRAFRMTGESVLGATARAVLGSRVGRSYYVTPRRLEKCLRDKQLRTDCPRYVGWSELLTVLNRRYPEDNYNLAHVEWLIKRYGRQMPIKDKMQIGSQLSAHALEKLKETFNHFDPQGDGTINESELSLALQAMGYPEMSSEEVSKKLASIDKNQSGDIDLDEFCVLVSGSHLDGTPMDDQWFSHTPQTHGSRSLTRESRSPRLSPRPSPAISRARASDASKLRSYGSTAKWRGLLDEDDVPAL